MHILTLALALVTSAFAGSGNCATGGTGTDADGDGQCSEATGGADCNDTDDDVYFGAPEICSNGIDESCSGYDSESHHLECGGEYSASHDAYFTYPTAIEAFDEEDNTSTVWQSWGLHNVGDPEARVPWVELDRDMGYHGESQSPAAPGHTWYYAVKRASFNYGGSAGHSHVLSSFDILPTLSFENRYDAYRNYNNIGPEDIADHLYDQLQGISYLEQALEFDMQIGGARGGYSSATSFSKFFDFFIGQPACTWLTCTIDPGTTYATVQFRYDTDETYHWEEDDGGALSTRMGSFDSLGSHVDLGDMTRENALEKGHAFLIEMTKNSWIASSLFTKAAGWALLTNNQHEDEARAGVAFAVPTNIWTTFVQPSGFAYPSDLTWGVCATTQTIFDGTDDVDMLDDLLSNFADAGMLRHYHLLGQGLKLVLLGTDKEQNGNKDRKTTVGLYIAYPSSDQAVVDALDTAGWTCQWGE
jgi:hypothetical protein